MVRSLKKYITTCWYQADENINLDVIFNPISKILTFFGLLPHGIKFSEAKGSYMIAQTSLYFNMVTATCVSLLCTICFVWHIQEIYAASDASSFQAVFLTILNYIVEMALFLFLCIVSCVKAFLDRNRYLDILNTIAFTWKEFPFLSDTMILKNIRAHIIFVMMGFFYTMILIHLIIHTTRNDGPIKIMLVLVTFVLTDIIHYVVIGFIRVVVLLAAATLENITEHLKALAKLEQMNQGIRKIETKSIIESLREMEGVYTTIFQVTREMNNCFQGMILLFALQCFHSMLSEGYVIYHGLAVECFMTTHEIINCSTWILFQFLKIYILSHTGQLLKVEVRRVGAIMLNTLFYF